MFDKIDSKVQNPELKEVLKDIWSGVRRTRVTMALLTIAMAIALVFVYTSKSEAVAQNTVIGSTDEVVITSGNDATPTKAAFTALATPTTSATNQPQPIEELIQVPVLISHRNYNDLYEYLEYGNTVEYAGNQDLTVEFNFQNGEVYYHHEEELTPPQFRAFINAFPYAVTYEKEGYQIQVMVKGEDVVSQVAIVDKNGKAVWNPLMEKHPRELNALEKWAIQWATDMGYDDWIIQDWFDECPEWGHKIGEQGCFPEYMEWSPAEVEARGMAFFEYATNPENKVWIEIWGAVDARYRWVDHESGEVLAFAEETFDYDDHVTLYQYPESGWIELQIGEGGTWENPEKWEPRYIIKMEPGIVLGIDQMGYIFESTPLGRMNYDFMAEQTREWSEEKILDLLKNIQAKEESD